MSSIARSSIIQRDPGQVGASLAKLGGQIRDGWKQAQAVRIPTSYRQIERVAVCGMGGSHLGPDILRSSLADTLKLPVQILADYRIPAWVDEKTLVICSSYSGSTEETLEALKIAVKQRRAKALIISGGGQLAHGAKYYDVPAYVFTPNENPSNQPRLGLGYSLAAFLQCFRAVGLLSVSGQVIASAAAQADRAVKNYGPGKTAKNRALELANRLNGKIPLLIGAEWTVGNLHAWTNQIHENAKSYATYYAIPDLNHHLLEGLRNPKITKQFHAVLVEDKSYHPRNLRRLQLTKKILEKAGAKTSIVVPGGSRLLEKAVDLLAFGGYVSWYMAAGRNISPAPIPTVDFLKAQLGKK